MGDEEKEKNVENPEVVQKSKDTSLDLAIHKRTTSLDMGRLCRWFESHDGLGGWAKRLVMPKRQELPKVTSYQRLLRTYQRYEDQEVRGPRGTKDRRGACSKRCLLRQVVSDPYESVYDLLSQDRPKAGSGKEVRWAIEPDFVDRSHLDSIWLDGLELRMVLVKPRSGEGSVIERLCNVWLDDATDELVIVYETVKKLCFGSHVSNPHTRSQLTRSHSEGKRTAGQSSRGSADGAGLSELPTDPVETNTGGVLPSDPANLTGTQQDSQQHQESDEEVESSNANRDGDQREIVADGTANAPAVLSNEDLIEAMKLQP
ncbi:hypothetical protein DY000_02014393 [Brassica cretica]|uniref:Uncharacterized protein n=1 Tax=Brassica cretica TaxID=69181 RepID=A0ABQ7D717_BRACR|nr:hypothetical protein DY000_02014393 [Brassica cretica]